MSRPMRTAVAAVSIHSVRRQVVHALAVAEVDLLLMAGDALAAFDALAALRPDLLVADVHLPAMEGTALVQQAMRTARLPVRPASIVLYDPQFPLFDRGTLDEMGVRFVQKPVIAKDFSIAVDALRSAPPYFPSAECRRIDALLDALGVPMHIGRECLRTAVLLCASDERCLHHLSATLYPRVGAYCGLSAVQAERAMRHAIGLAWQSDQFDNQYRIFADTVDAGRGQPTCGEMISRLADILRLEG